MSTIQKKSPPGPQASTLHRLDPASDEYKRTHKAILDSLHERCSRQESNIEVLTQAVKQLGGQIS